MIRIADSAAFDAWLDERNGFEDDRLAKVEQSGDGVVTLMFEQLVLLGPRPGDEEAVDQFELVVAAPIEFESFDGADDQWLEGVDVHELDGRMAIVAETGIDRVRIVADEVAVRRIGTRRYRKPPLPSGDFTVVTGVAHDDLFWSSKVSEMLGVPVAWRVLGGLEPRRPGQDIDGCFLQEVSRLSTTNYGVFCSQSPARTKLDRRQDVDTELWRAVQQAGASAFDRFQSGNCVFDSSDWSRYLATGEFPPDHRLRGSLSEAPGE